MLKGTHQKMCKVKAGRAVVNQIESQFLYLLGHANRSTIPHLLSSQLFR